MSDMTQLLTAIGQGDNASRQELLAKVYQELRELAAHMTARETPGQGRKFCQRGTLAKSHERDAASRSARP